MIKLRFDSLDRCKINNETLKLFIPNKGASDSILTNPHVQRIGGVFVASDKQRISEDIVGEKQLAAPASLYVLNPAYTRESTHTRSSSSRTFYAVISRVTRARAGLFLPTRTHIMWVNSCHCK